MLLYSLALVVVLIAGSPYWLLRMLTSGRYRAGLWGRLGRIPPGLRAAVQGKQVVWLHAVSVGEVLAATRLVRELEEALNRPGADHAGEWIIVVSTTTATGQALARERFPNPTQPAPAQTSATRVFWYPLDLAWAVRAYLRAFQPRLLVLMESELWPRMLHECRRRAIPVAVVNARVSDRSFARSLKLRPLWSRLLRQVTLFLAQSQQDATRLAALGARPESVQLSGNLKYDIRAPKQSRVADLIRTAAAGRPILVAGSTVDASPVPEEELLLNALAPIWQAHPDTLLILAPRHPERFDRAQKIAAAIAPTLRATELLASPPRPLAERVLLLDTLGDLAAVYGVAGAAFVGGSLVPRGGHNPLEPAQFGVPVLMGPHFQNFRDIVTRMLQANAIVIANTPEDCAQALLSLLTDRACANAIGLRARALFEQQQGATQRTVASLLALLQPSKGRPE